MVVNGITVNFGEFNLTVLAGTVSVQRTSALAEAFIFNKVKDNWFAAFLTRNDWRNTKVFNDSELIHLTGIKRSLSRNNYLIRLL